MTQQIHDFNPGTTSPPSAGLFWVIPTTPDAVDVNPGAGTASLRMTNVGVIDAHDLANALTGGKGFASMSIPPIAPVPAIVSFDIEWSGAFERAIVINQNEDFSGQYVKTNATIEWSASEAGFVFTSNPASTSINVFAVVGHERNGVFFHGRK